MKRKNVIFPIGICLILSLVSVLTMGCYSGAVKAEPEMLPTVKAELPVISEIRETPFCEVQMPSTPAVKEEKVTLPSRPVLWDLGVSLISSYQRDDGNLMTYLLYTPTNIQEGQKLPLLVWLHGSGEVNAGELTMRSAGLPGVLESMEVTPNAFILCPQLTGYLYNWRTPGALQGVTKLIDYIIAANPAIDKDNISIAGHSLGGAGCLYMAQNLPIFRRVASLSPYDPNIPLTLNASDVRLYVGSSNYGEDGYCILFSAHLTDLYGFPAYSCDSSHGNLPRFVFTDGFAFGSNDAFDWLLTEPSEPASDTPAGHQEVYF